MQIWASICMRLSPVVDNWLPCEVLLLTVVSVGVGIYISGLCELDSSNPYTLQAKALPICILTVKGGNKFCSEKLRIQGCQWFSF